MDIYVVTCDVRNYALYKNFNWYCKIFVSLPNAVDYIMGMYNELKKGTDDACHFNKCSDIFIDRNEYNNSYGKQVYFATFYNFVYASKEAYNNDHNDSDDILSKLYAYRIIKETIPDPN
jgi:hypothetical protein